MSTWGDIYRRAEGEELRREDEFRPRTIDDLWEEILKDVKIPGGRIYEDLLSSMEEFSPEELQEILGTL